MSTIQSPGARTFCVRRRSAMRCKASCSRSVCMTVSDSSKEGPGHFSWWDYRQAAFRRNLGLRIDLILASEALMRERCRSVTIDRASVARGSARRITRR